MIAHFDYLLKVRTVTWRPTSVLGRTSPAAYVATRRPMSVMERVKESWLADKNLNHLFHEAI